MFMKSNIQLFCLTLILSVFLFSGCKKEKDTQIDSGGSKVIVEKKNTAMINKFTGSNCYYCGDWGWTLFESLINKHHGIDAVCLGSYSQNVFADLFITSVATAMDRRLPVSQGYPTFSANFEDAWKAPQGDQSAYIDNIVKSHKESKVIANSATNYSVSGNKLKVDVVTEFFENESGVFNLSVIVLEDSVMGFQNGPNGGPRVAHHNVIRASNGDWGEVLASGQIAAGSRYTQSVEIPLESTWNKEKIEIVTVIWRQNNGAWDFVNAHLDAR